MAWPASTQTATFDKTISTTRYEGTFDTSVDSKLWPALMAKSPLIDMTSRFPVQSFEFKWETANAPTRRFTCSATTDTTIDGSGDATNNKLGLTGGSSIQKGSMLKNVSRATPIGTYGADEIMEVTANTSGVLTLVRDAGRQNSGTGSTAHTTADIFEVIVSPKEEGSSADENKYKDVTLVTGYTNIVDFYLTVTGSFAAVSPLVAGDTLQAQFENALTELTNEIEGMLLYGVLNYGGSGTPADAYAGSDTYVRRTQGLDQYICASGANIDYSTKSVTEEAINALMASILEDKTDPSDRFIIVCHPKNARTISSFGADKVITSPEKSKWGRYIDTLRTDLGVDLPVIWTLNCSKSDLFIIDMNKIAIAQFRPFAKATWTYGDDGVDAWRQRYLGEIGVKVVDGLYSHAKLGYISWS